ncbi:MAG: sigma-70 family RNA polymerase sigma factor [Oscillospiraceae bacterium]|nr:sigma-70 family RNA polymerase sigma factor [Oscillospiraceae bacterium]
MLSDKEIYSLLTTNPEKGIARIMNEYMAFVYTIVYGKLSGITSKQEIEECVSDVFYEVYRTRSSIDLEKGSLKAYIAVLSKRRAVDLFRRLVKRVGEVSTDDLNLLTSGENVENSVINAETSEILLTEIKNLGEPDSQVIIRKYYLGQSTKIISKALGLKPNTVDKKVSRALVKLKQALGGAI